MWFVHLLSVPLLIGLNAFFVAAEYAVVATRSVQLAAMKRNRWLRAARAMERLRADMPSAIGAIQVCITMTNLLLGWLGEPAMSRVLHAALSPLGVVLPGRISTIIATGLSFLIVTLLTVVLSELLPKALTLQHTLEVAKLTAVPMLIILRVIRPLVILMNAFASGVTRLLGLGPVKIESEIHTRDEIMLIATEAATAGTLTPGERALVLNSLTLGRKTAKQIMVPRIRVDHLDLRKSMSENADIVSRSLYSRLPLTNGGMDHIVGVVYTKEFLTAYDDQPDTTFLLLIARKPVFIPASLSLNRILATFREEKAGLLFLVDEYGGVDGIVTLTDVIDELLDEPHVP
jgi:CBS domain containing-hemolysin-like protein